MTGAAFAAWATRATFVAMLAVMPFLPSPSTGFWIFPHARNFWSLMFLGGLFLLGLVDNFVRRPLLFIDLLVLLSVVPAAGYTPYPWCWVLLYPAMIYLGVRMWVIARSGRDGSQAPGGLDSTARPRSELLPRRWLVLGIAVLAVVHVAWTLNSATFTDVEYAGVYGATTVTEGRTLYRAQPELIKLLKSEANYDTYGPVNYEAYVPFTLIAGVQYSPHRVAAADLYAPFSSVPKARQAAQLTTVFFDLLTAALLFWLGLQVFSWRAGVTLAFAWLALPIVAYTDTFGVNDTIVAAALVATLLAARHRGRLGAMAALTAWTKFSPLAIVPLLAGHSLRSAGDGQTRRRRLTVFAGGFLAMSLVVFLPLVFDNDPGSFLTRTIGFQASRNTGDSIWTAFDEGFFGRAELIRNGSVVLHALLIGAVVVSALAMFRTRLRADVVGLAAASGALMIAVQICQGFYVLDYMLWFLPLVIVALLLDLAPTVRPLVVGARTPAEAHMSSEVHGTSDAAVAGRSAFTESH